MLKFMYGFFVFYTFVMLYHIFNYFKLKKVRFFIKGNVEFKYLQRYSDNYARIYREEYKKALKKDKFLYPDAINVINKVCEKVYRKGIDNKKLKVVCLYYNDICMAYNDLEQISFINKIHKTKICGYSVCENTKGNCFVLIFIEKEIKKNK